MPAIPWELGAAVATGMAGAIVWLAKVVLAGKKEQAEQSQQHATELAELKAAHRAEAQELRRQMTELDAKHSRAMWEANQERLAEVREQATELVRLGSDTVRALERLGELIEHNVTGGARAAARST